jgi:hypothetical protein
MATYQELYALGNSTTLGALRTKIRVGIAIKAQLIASDAQATAAQRDWAIKALNDPNQYEAPVLNYILAANNTATTAQIETATDAVTQNAVNNAVDTLLGA